MNGRAAELGEYVREVADFPKPGVVFKDITPLLADAKALVATIDALAEPFVGQHVDRVVGIEARGFIIAAPVAYRLGAGLIPVRKPGKLPFTTMAIDYDLEYGTDRLELHTDSIAPGERVLIVDDVLATGGTAAATIDLVRQLGGEVVGCTFVIELAFLQGRQKLGTVPVTALLEYA
jgi:adenine phosphoribosyltransferase